MSSIQLHYSLISIRQNYNFDMLAMKLFVDFWKFTKIWKGLQNRNKELLFVLTFRCAEQFYVPNTQKQSKMGNKSRNQQKIIRYLMA